MVGFDTSVVPNTSGLPITVTTKAGKTSRRTALSLPCAGAGVRFGVHNNSLTNVLRGLVERVFKVQGPTGLQAPPRPTAGVFRELTGFKTMLLRRLGSCRPWTIDEFVNSYKGAKQALMRAAAESLSTRPLTKSDATLKTFVKAEKLNLSSKPDPAPRVIQPRDPRYNCVVGPYLKAHEHHVYQAIAEVWGGPTVMKGFNAVGQANAIRDMWDEFEDPVAVGLDASRFDQHVSKEALEFEHSVYNSMFRSPELQRALRYQLVNVGKAYTPQGVVRYSVSGCRMSGDMNTALGNCLLMCAMVHSLCDNLGIPARLANNGDDCVVIMNKCHLHKFMAHVSTHFLRYGFTMKVEEPVDVFERIEFCQTKPVWNGETWVMCRNPAVCLDKDTLCLHPDSMPYADWLGAVGKCGLALTSGIPVLQAFYTGLIGRGTNRVEHSGTGMAYLAQGLVATPRPISEEARLSFYKAFGITPWAQVALEDELPRVISEADLGLIVPSQLYQVPTHSCALYDQYA